MAATNQTAQPTARGAILSLLDAETDISTTNWARPAMTALTMEHHNPPAPQPAKLLHPAQARAQTPPAPPAIPIPSSTNVPSQPRASTRPQAKTTVPAEQATELTDWSRRMRDSSDWPSLVKSIESLLRRVWSVIRSVRLHSRGQTAARRSR